MFIKQIYRTDITSHKCYGCVWGRYVGMRYWCMFNQCRRSVMATRPQRPCRHSGCDQLTRERYCEAHAKQHNTESNAYYNSQRASSAERGYDNDWDKFRLLFLKERPLCVDCLTKGRTRAAKEVHHIIRLRDGGERLNAMNCMGLCKPCHSRRSIRGE